jgi:hypothetical protein
MSIAHSFLSGYGGALEFGKQLLRGLEHRRRRLAGQELEAFAMFRRLGELPDWDWTQRPEEVRMLPVQVGLHGGGARV